MLSLVVATDEWWKSLDKKQQDAYIKEHPNSKYAKNAKQSDTKGVSPVPKKTPPWTVKSNKPKFNDQTKVYDTKTNRPKGVSFWAYGFHKDVGIGWIENIQIDEKYKGKGLGSKLVSQMEKQLQSDGAKEIRGEALKGSIPFWKKMGYEVMDDSTNKNRFPIRKILFS